MPLDIIPRADWQAEVPTSKLPLLTPVESVLLTYTSTDPCTSEDDCKKLLRDIQKKQMEEQSMPDIQWNFMIGANGSVFEGRGWNTNATKEPEHTPLDFKSLDIAYIGRTKEKDVTPEMIGAVSELIRYGIENKHINDTFDYVESKDYTNFVA
ncbi:peptidoglycan-recognition protein 2-like [Macrosteles quadrilineatus]|uniref:peptidoglycan-recognition protein 2-like n=1 Tax=Macrosteles quadrilineatus TaxID=74068 RepID=UPI0023E21CEF|nr:peptidoglycan-recognition protein 2-like [Macrosteles quadrilineatus]